MRFFNTTGPVVAADHYCVPPLARLDPDELLRLVRDKRYFVLHAPRQTGKTSALLALRESAAGRGFPVCVRQRRRRTDGPRGRGAGHARRAGRAGLVGGRGGRRVPGPDLARSAGAVRSRRRVARGTDALGGCRPAPAGAADRRDRRADRRLAAGRAAAVARRLRPAAGGISAERGAVRGAGRAGLPHPFRVGERDRRRGQRVQREGEVAVAGGLPAGRRPGAAGAAHGGDGAGVHVRSAGTGVGTDSGTAVAGERAGGGSLL